MRRDNAHGFTLVELVTVVVLLGVLAVVGLPILSNGTRAYAASEAALATLGKLRYTTERLAREIREVRRDPAAPDDYDIAVMTAAKFQFTKADGVEVTLAAAPPRLTLRYATPATDPAPVLTDGLAAFGFKYLKADGVTETTSKREVAFVEVSITLARDGTLYPQRTRVGLRNKL